MKFYGYDQNISYFESHYKAYFWKKKKKRIKTKVV